MTTTIAPEAPTTDTLRLWLDLVEDKLAGDYDTGELHRLVVDCDIDPRMTGQSATVFATLVEEVISSGQLAGMIEDGYFATAVPQYTLILDDRLVGERAVEVKQIEYFKGRTIDPIANMIIAEVSTLAREDRRDRVNAILAEIRERIEV